MSKLSAEEELARIKASAAARCKQYKKTPPEKISSYNRNYYAANKARISAQRKARRQAMKEGASDD